MDITCDHLCKTPGGCPTATAVATVENTALGAPPHHPHASPVFTPQIPSRLTHRCWPTLSVTLSSTRVTGEGPAVPRLL